MGRRRINPVGYILILPAFIMWLIFNTWPVIRGLAMAFQDYRFLYPETQGLFTNYIGLRNFAELLGDTMFRHSFTVSLKYTLMYLPASIILALVVATFISKTEGLWASFFRVIVYLPVVLPIAAAMLVWKKLYDPQFGYLNVILSHIARRKVDILWLGSALALPATAISSLWKHFGYNTLLFLIGIYGINRELYDAAAIDGAGSLGQWRYVTVPLLRPIFTLILVMQAGVMGATQEMMIMTAGGPGDHTLTTGLYLWRVAFQFGDMRMGYAAAVGLTLGIIHMLLSAIIFRLMRAERA